MVTLIHFRYAAVTKSDHITTQQHQKEYCFFSMLFFPGKYSRPRLRDMCNFSVLGLTDVVFTRLKA